MKKYKIKTTSYTEKDIESGTQMVYYKVHIQMRVLGIFWIDVRRPIESESYDYAKACAEEVVEYLTRQN